MPAAVDADWYVDSGKRDEGEGRSCSLDKTSGPAGLAKDEDESVLAARHDEDEDEDEDENVEEDEEEEDKEGGGCCHKGWHPHFACVTLFPFTVSVPPILSLIFIIIIFHQPS